MRLCVYLLTKHPKVFNHSTSFLGWRSAPKSDSILRKSSRGKGVGDGGGGRMSQVSLCQIHTFWAFNLKPIPYAARIGLHLQWFDYIYYRHIFQQNI